MDPVSRRCALKLMAGGTLALYLSPAHRALAESLQGKAGMPEFSPIDRTLGDVADAQFFADDPERAHKVLWDKPGFIQSLPGKKLPSPTEKAPLVIIGGGMSGLFSAYLLREHKPVVLEQATRFGGNAKGQSWKGIDYSIGAAYFIEPDEDSDIAKLCSELNLDQDWKLKEEEDPVLWKGQVYEEFWTGESAPEAKEQFEKLRKYFEAVNVGEEYPYPDIPIVDPEQEQYIKDLDKVSFKAHLEKIAGGPLHQQIETAIEQYCWSSFNASSQEISAASGLNFYASEFSNLILFPGGNSAVAERVLSRLVKDLPPTSLRPGSLVFDVTVTKEGVNVSYQDAQSNVHCIQAKAVVMACPKFVAKKVLSDIEPARVAAIDKIRYRSYLVANVLLKQVPERSFYDLYMLGTDRINFSDVTGSAQKQKITDVILATYAKPNADHTVLTLYRGMPYEGARADLYAPGSYGRYREGFEKQIYESILPVLKLDKQNVVDLRIARWGHPLPVAGVGLIADGTLEAVRKPFRDRVFFVEQDNWALPAFETAVTEALSGAELVKAFLAKA
ncbi:MAG: FAD-dependent oxidoreductase [Bdellovibrionota bacterium]